MPSDWPGWRRTVGGMRTRYTPGPAAVTLAAGLVQLLPGGPGLGAGAGDGLVVGAEGAPGGAVVLAGAVGGHAQPGDGQQGGRGGGPAPPRPRSGAEGERGGGCGRGG